MSMEAAALNGLFSLLTSGNAREREQAEAETLQNHENRIEMVEAQTDTNATNLAVLKRQNDILTVVVGLESVLLFGLLVWCMMTGGKSSKAKRSDSFRIFTQPESIDIP